jgi:hypothetical protein
MMVSTVVMGFPSERPLPFYKRAERVHVPGQFNNVETQER